MKYLEEKGLIGPLKRISHVVPRSQVGLFRQWSQTTIGSDTAESYKDSTDHNLVAYLSFGITEVGNEVLEPPRLRSHGGIALRK